MRRGVELLREQNVLLFDGLLKIALAEAEARAGDPDRAIAILDEALATCDRTGYRAFEAELHRARGEILLKRDPANPAPAEEAFLTAIAVAKQQGTRSFELRAALSLAKLYQSTGRPADAHAVLAPALEGFAPTPEMPEIAEAQALLAALAETDEVKAEAAQRQRLTHCMSPTATRSLRRAATARRKRRKRSPEPASRRSGDKDAPERLAADYGLWVGSFVAGRVAGDEGARDGLPQRRRGETQFARGRRRPSRSRNHCWFAGEYREAQDHLERALALFQPGRDDDLAFRFGQDAGRRGDALSRAYVVAAGRRRTRDFPHRRRCRRGSRASRMSARSRTGKCTRRCSN